MSVPETTHLLQRAIASECLFNGDWIPASGSVIPVIGYPEPSKHGWATSIPLSITATWTPNPAQVAGSAVEAAPAAAHPASASIVARPGSPPSMGE